MKKLIDLLTSPQLRLHAAILFGFIGPVFGHALSRLARESLVTVRHPAIQRYVTAVVRKQNRKRGGFPYCG